MDKTDVQNWLKKYIGDNDTIIVGVSGGSDSIYLLHQLLSFKKTQPINIVVAHVNHKLRGVESDDDAKFVQAEAKKFHLKFEQKSLSKILKGNLEEELRNRRYAFFEKLRSKHKAKWIITAHHRDDNIETILFNLVRGSFFGGLKGMEMASKSRNLLRPLLNTDKQQILDYLKKKSLLYRIDPSNSDTRFARNLLRHKVIPQLKIINLNFENTFSENIGNFSDTADYLEEQAKNWITQNNDNKNIPLRKFLLLSAIMQKTVLVELYKDAYGSTNKFNLKHLAQILKVINEKKAGLKKEFGNKYFLQITRQKGGSERVISIVNKPKNH